MCVNKSEQLRLASRECTIKFSLLCYSKSLLDWAWKHCLFNKLGLNNMRLLFASKPYQEYLSFPT